jgi:tetratricopeptide (TPR) repeat protein
VQVDPNAKDLADYRQEAQRKLAETRRVQADIYNREGLKAYSEGNFRAAVNHWKKVLEIYPDHPSAKRNLERVKQELRELP